jgi:hypothetical protein
VSKVLKNTPRRRGHEVRHARLVALELLVQLNDGGGIVGIGHLRLLVEETEDSTVAEKRLNLPFVCLVPGGGGGGGNVAA